MGGYRLLRFSVFVGKNLLHQLFSRIRAISGLKISHQLKIELITKLKMENGGGSLTQHLSALTIGSSVNGYTNTNGMNKSDGLFQVMKAVEAAEATIKQQEWNPSKELEYEGTLTCQVNEIQSVIFCLVCRTLNDIRMHIMLKEERIGFVMKKTNEEWHSIWLVWQPNKPHNGIRDSNSYQMHYQNDIVLLVRIINMLTIDGAQAVIDDL
ncbi:unnamed protein product [Lactuca saligna]|uniref:Uncharacterized protein n=1 Tax=Lactuca saligna TaxID=75948 RepID=A0AA35YP20_LACSI|nr:unnamed protein product [Lactuca saligna]